MAHLCRNSQLEWLDVSCPLATSASFAEVTRLSQLRHLGTWGWKIDNDDIEQLATLPKLESLGLGTPSVTDESVPYILRLPHIRELRLTGDGITDASLHHFQQHGALERLDLYHTAVNKLSPAAKDLQAALPNCDCVFPRTPEEEARHRRWKISLYKLTPSKLVTRKPSIAKRND